MQGPKLFSHYAQPDARCATWIRSASFTKDRNITLQDSCQVRRSIAAHQQTHGHVGRHICLPRFTLWYSAWRTLCSALCESLHSRELRALDSFSSYRRSNESIPDERAPPRRSVQTYRTITTARREHPPLAVSQLGDPSAASGSDPSVTPVAVRLSLSARHADRRRQEAVDDHPNMLRRKKKKYTLHIWRQRHSPAI